MHVGEEDYLLANRRASREIEIERHGQAKTGTDTNRFHCLRFLRLLTLILLSAAKFLRYSDNLASLHNRNRRDT